MKGDADEPAAVAAAAAAKPITLEQALEQNLCGMCSKMWRNCACNASTRTESISTLLSNNTLFPHVRKRHLCLFIYHSYQRWTTWSDGDDEDFSAACLPPWEGWYAAWLKLNTMSQDVPWSEQPVIQCTIHYQNGTSLPGYLQSNGKLTLHIPGPCPPHGRDYDHDRRTIRAHVQISQGLTQEEIKSGIRGVVHGTNRVPNNGRKASHIVSESATDGTASLCTIAERVGDEVKIVSVGTERVRSFAPHLYDEVRWRVRRRFSKRLGRSVVQYLSAMFRRARESDAAARFAYSRGWVRAMPRATNLLKAIVEDLPALAGTVAADGSEGMERAEEGTERYWTGARP